MCLPFLSCYPLEVTHLCSLNGRPNQRELSNNCCLSITLIVYHEDLQVLNILELHVAKVDRRSIKLLLCNPGRKSLKIVLIHAKFVFLRALVSKIESQVFFQEPNKVLCNFSIGLTFLAFGAFDTLVVKLVWKG